jgi:hypothetical protein
VTRVEHIRRESAVLQRGLSDDAISRSGADTVRTAGASWDRWLAVAANATLCILLPIVMVLANKSAPATLALGSMLANASALLAGQQRTLARRYRDTLVTGSGLLLALFLAWSILSVGWSISPAMTWRGIRETAPELVFGWALAAAWPIVARRNDLRLLGVGIVLSALLIAFEAGTHLILHQLLGARAFAFDLKRSSIPPLLLLWPAVALAEHVRHRRMMVLLVIFAEVGSAVSHSSASIVAVVLGALVYLLARATPRFGLGLYASVIVLGIVTAPWTGTLASWVVSPRVGDLLAEQHAEQRVAIWTAFEHRVFERAILGHGFDTSFRIADAAGTPDGRPGEAVIQDIHPHNQLMQVWIDFGLVGALGVLLGLGWLMSRLRSLPVPDLAARLAFLASATMMGLVGVQAWDAWWLATLATSWAAFTTIRHHAAGPEPGPHRP